MKKKILISGGTGFIGRAFIEKTKGSYDFYVLRRPSSNITGLTGVNFINYAEVKEKLPGLKPELFIHLASKAVFHHDQHSLPEILDANITTPTLVLESFFQSGGRKVINIGSYWQHMENQTYRPNSLYAATKEAFEDLLDYYAVHRGGEILSLHLFDTYGPADPRKKLLNLVFESASSGTPLSLTSGEQLIAYTHVDDVVRAIDHSMTVVKAGHAKFLAKPAETKKLKEVIEIFLKVNGLTADLSWNQTSHSARDFFTEVTALPTLPGWKSEIPLSQGLRGLFEVHTPVDKT